jgi:nucleoside-diphosphate-sugar epimerase
MAPKGVLRIVKCIVTGAAGFIGSHLCEELLASGHVVTGVDCFVPYYSSATKESNLAGCRAWPNFRFARLDLRRDPIDPLLDDVEVIFHLAAMPGLVRSWTDLDGYWSCNVQATQRLLDTVRRAAPGLHRLIYASTSSVYGRFASGDETLPTRPISPYGITKLAGENLCRAYADAHGLPVVALRYFSVYGPRQRPDMGYQKFIRALLREEPVTVCGDGQQVRGNTYITDCITATIAAVAGRPGEVFNVGGGETANVWDIIHKLEALAGRRALIRQEPSRSGDQRYTFADTSRLRSHLDWEPRVGLNEGLASQWAWQQAMQELESTPAALASVGHDVETISLTERT